MRRASRLIPCRLGIQQRVEKSSGRWRGRAVCEWRQTGLNYRFRADQRAGVEPVFFQGVNDPGDGSS